MIPTGLAMLFVGVVLIALGLMWAVAFRKD